MAEMRPELEAPVLIGVGAAFDFHAGLVPQAPDWLQDVGPRVGLSPGTRAAAAVAALPALQPAVRGRVHAPAARAPPPSQSSSSAAAFALAAAAAIPRERRPRRS